MTSILSQYEVYLNHCGRRGHFAQDCQNQGNDQGECLSKSSQGHSQQPVGVWTLCRMPTLTHTNRAAYTVEKVNNKTIRILLDSGTSCSVILADYARKSEIKPITATKLVDADGRNIIPHEAITMTVTLGDFSVCLVCPWLGLVCGSSLWPINYLVTL